MLGEQVARQAGEALVADVCARAKHNGCNLMDQPTDKLVGYVKVRRWLFKRGARVKYRLWGTA